MKDYTFYNSGGAIEYSTRLGTPPTELPVDWGYVEGDYGSSQYYVDKSTNPVSVKRRPILVFTREMKKDGATYIGLPIPCTVFVDGISHDVDDGVCELSFILPGSYAVEIVAFPFLTFKCVEIIHEDSN
jgi:hypothetical protein